MAATARRPALIRLHPADNVAVAPVGLLPAQTAAWPGGECTARERIPPLHKIAIAPIASGQPIRKYGQVIGFARGDIPAGTHVHTANVVLGEFAREPACGTEARPLPPLPLLGGEHRTFAGYPRPDGRAGTRNYLAVISRPPAGSPPKASAPDWATRSSPPGCSDPSSKPE